MNEVCENSSAEHIEQPAAHSENPMTVHWLKENLEKSFSLPPDAVEWLMSLWHVLQVFDDYADGDPVERHNLDATIWNTLVGMPSNPFFARNAGAIVPALSLLILKWQASDKAERQGFADERSFVWRSGYYDLVLLAVQLTHGTDAAHRVAYHVMNLYGEKYADYKQEFPNG